MDQTKVPRRSNDISGDVWCSVSLTACHVWRCQFN